LIGPLETDVLPEHSEICLAAVRHKCLGFALLRRSGVAQPPSLPCAAPTEIAAILHPPSLISAIKAV
jgi:hypothetical protein